MMKYLNWISDNWLHIIATIIVSCILYCAMQNKEIKYYYLEPSGDRFMITAEIDYFPNSSITLDETITIQEAVEIVERLNKTIKIRNDSM